MGGTRRAFGLACAVVGCVAMLGPASSEAADVAVPVPLQGELLLKVAAYDKNLAARAMGKVHVLIVVRPGDLASEHAAKQMEQTLGGAATIGGMPHDEATVPFEGASALVKTVKQRHAAIVYLTSGFDEGELGDVATAFTGVDVLTVGALATYVPHGTVLGFDLVSSKPKLLCHLGQAKKQNVAFKAEVLKLMRVYE
ncbi:MAG: hypothetical protein NVS3B10_25800 [Polyangiales bacterium]